MNTITSSESVGCYIVGVEQSLYIAPVIIYTGYWWLFGLQKAHACIFSASNHNLATSKVNAGEDVCSDSDKRLKSVSRRSSYFVVCAPFIRLSKVTIPAPVLLMPCIHRITRPNRCPSCRPHFRQTTVQWRVAALPMHAAVPAPCLRLRRPNCVAPTH